MQTHHDLIILGIIYHEPLHAYRLENILKRYHMRTWARIVSRPALYKRLKVLEERGFLYASKEKVGNTPERTVFTLSEDGKIYLRHLVSHALCTGGFLGQDFIAALPFVGILPREDVLKCVDTYLEKLAALGESTEKNIILFKTKQYEFELLLKFLDDHIKTRIDIVHKLRSEIETTDQWGSLPQPLDVLDDDESVFFAEE